MQTINTVSIIPLHVLFHLFNQIENDKGKPTSEVNTLRPRRNGHFADDIFKRIFFNVNVCIPIKFHWCLQIQVQVQVCS